MAAGNASLGVRSDHWKIAVARAERLENVRPRSVSFIVGNSQKSLGARSGEYGVLSDNLRQPFYFFSFQNVSMIVIMARVLQPSFYRTAVRVFV